MIDSRPPNGLKWLVLLVFSALLAALLFIGPDGLNMPVESRLDTSPVARETVMADTASAETQATNTPNTTPAIARPSIDNAGYRIEGDIQILTLVGAADRQCDLSVSLGDNEITPINRESGGAWSVDVASPDVGTFEVRVECYVEGELLAFNARDLKVEAPEETVSEAASVDETAVEENGDAAEPATDEPAAENEEAQEAGTENAAVEASAAEGAETQEAGAEEAVVEEAIADDVVITGELYDLAFGNEMVDWRVGYLLVRGKGTPGASVAVIFANGDGTVESGTLVNGDGVWAIRAFLDKPGEFQVTARSGENTATVGSVTVPEGIFYASSGFCNSGIAPFGALENNQYTVSDCEFFGLIAKRLAVPVGDLRAANPQIFNLNLIKAGDVINVPPLP